MSEKCSVGMVRADQIRHGPEGCVDMGEAVKKGGISRQGGREG